MGLVRGFVDLVSPPACFACGEQSYQPLCESCLLMIEPLSEPLCPVCGHPMVTPVERCAGCRREPPAFDSAHTLAIYEFPLREAIIALKRRDGRCLADQLAPLLAEPFGDLFDGADWLTYVPMAPGPQMTRGHNQARELALALSHLSGTPAIGALRMTHFVKDQGQLPPADRPDNVAGAFAPRNSSRRLAAMIDGRDFVLIDDVLTTGATASACAAALKKAGAARVDVVTIARAARL
jgi:predicted amidophosphoribosyltransferase